MLIFCNGVNLFINANVIFVDILLTFCGNSAITRYIFETPTKSFILLIGYFFASRSLNER